MRFFILFFSSFAAQPRPNILFILTDDQGWAADEVMAVVAEGELDPQ